MEGWRLALAGNIALRNKNLSLDDLNAAVQLTIDRVVFLRMAEDRGLEPYEQLLKLCERPDVYSRFMHDLSRRADQKYNSGLFHFQKESGVTEEPDRITPKLTVDDKVFKLILESLYFAHGSPYQFGVMPVELLGTVYERFLGKVIRLTAGHQAKLEEKPDVRKAGGVYYTPAYIVAYVVDHTVGQQIEGRSPAILAGSKDKPTFRILDMACGSGSFLLGAYSHLLDYFLNWCIEHKPENFKKAVYTDTRNGHWRLTIEEKKRILATHIFGVDIDPQAVEVTKLSLLLKVLEGETDQSLSLSQLAFGDRALPNLAENIQCGNSLIGPDYFKGKLFSDPEEMRRVNPFDWTRRFPDAIKAGGFDCIVGNPPYIRVQTLQEWAPFEVEFYKLAYGAASAGNYDIYVVFVEKGLSLLNKTGTLGFILPHKFFNAKYGQPIRSVLAKGKHLSEVVHFGDQQIFDGATNYTCLLFLEKSGRKEFMLAKVGDLDEWRNSGKGIVGMIPASRVGPSEWNFDVGDTAALFEKLRRMPIKLGDVAERILQGLVTGADSVFVLADRHKGRYFSDATEQVHRLERSLMHRLCKGSVNIRRYWVSELTKSILFPYRLAGDEAILLTPEELKADYPLAWKYLQRNRRALESRERGKWRNDRWYALGRSQNLSQMEQKKILTPSIAKSASFTLDREEFYYFLGSGGGGGGGYGITLKMGERMAYEYVVGLLNSKLLDRFLQSFSSPFSGGYYAYNRQYIEQLPIHKIDFSSPTDKSRHDKVVALVNSMLVLHKQLAAMKSVAQKDILQRQIEATDRQIDQLVYQLYGLTEQEIALVEGQ